VHVTAFYLLGLAACLPLGVWLFRFWFDDLDTFMHEFGYRQEDHWSWQLIWTSLNDGWWVRLVFGVVAPYLICAVMLGLSLAHVLG
jgi:hypothetical protein